jgi:DNA-directed RNA polymerase specialized sigma24 family protein
VDVALARMPSQWRRALLLRYSEGLTGAALATALHRTPAETERILDNARAFLRQHLEESGCRLKESETRT